MTTIAFKDGVLASDTLSVYGGNAKESFNAQKIMRGKNGALLAMCGDFGPVHSFATALAKGVTNQAPLPKDCGRVVEIRRTGKIIVHEGGGSYPLRERSFSYGSGSDAARGAMLAGASAARAVRIASKVDINTGGRVRILALKK